MGFGQYPQRPVVPSLRTDPVIRPHRGRPRPQGVRSPPTRPAVDSPTPVPEGWVGREQRVGFTPVVGTALPVALSVPQVPVSGRPRTGCGLGAPPMSPVQTGRHLGVGGTLGVLGTRMMSSRTGGRSPPRTHLRVRVARMSTRRSRVWVSVRRDGSVGVWVLETLWDVSQGLDDGGVGGPGYPWVPLWLPPYTPTGVCRAGGGSRRSNSGRRNT